MLNARVDRSATKAIVALKGAMDESSDEVLGAIRPRLARVHVTFDLMAVEVVNSIGFRHWQRFLHALKGEATFEFINCPATFVDYAGLLANTAYAEHVCSVQVPYRCEACRRDATVVVEVDAIEAQDEQFEPHLCTHCNGFATALVTPEEFVGPLKRR